MASGIGGLSGGAGASGGWTAAPAPKSIQDQINDIAFGPPGAVKTEPAKVSNQSIQDKIHDIAFGAPTEPDATPNAKDAISGLTSAFGAPTAESPKADKAKDKASTAANSASKPGKAEGSKPEGTKSSASKSEGSKSSSSPK
jgi:hypothetical protein